MKQKIDKMALWRYSFSMEPVKPNFELLDHTADLGISVNADNLAGLFEAAASAMMRIMVKTIHSVKSRKVKQSVHGADLQDLMVRWLSEILYLLEGENRVVNRTRVLTIDTDRLTAELETSRFSEKHHEITSEIKAVTYHGIAVHRQDNRWRSQIIFDL